MAIIKQKCYTDLTTKVKSSSALEHIVVAMRMCLKNSVCRELNRPGLCTMLPCFYMKTTLWAPSLRLCHGFNFLRLLPATIGHEGILKQVHTYLGEGGLFWWSTLVQGLPACPAESSLDSKDAFLSLVHLGSHLHCIWWSSAFPSSLPIFFHRHFLYSNPSSFNPILACTS